MDHLKRDFLDIDLTMFFRARNLENTSAMRVILNENVPNLKQISKIKKKIQKKFFVLEIISSELVALNRLYQQENTCHLLSVC